MNKKLQITESKTREATSSEHPEEKIERGQWYWIKDEDGDKQLACVTHVGSNYAKLRMPGYHSSWRIHFDNFDKRTKREYKAEEIIQANVSKHQEKVQVLLGKIKLLCQNLGLNPKSLTSGQSNSTTALVVAHGTTDVKAHKNALIKAKKKTLPDLFKKVEEEHEMVALWMKAPLVPMKAETTILEKQTEGIEDKIFTVELYAGLCEETVKIRDGKPASNDEQVCLFQRRHYMDEECLLDYRAGGMDFKRIGDFDQWLLKKANRDRILPFPKCIVAFRIRRHGKDRGRATTYDEFISFANMTKWDESTFLYIRNGERYYRLETDIDFGADLFPDKGVLPLTEGKLYIDNDSSRGTRVISEDQLNEIKAKNVKKKAEHKEEKKEHKEALKAWRALSKAQRKGKSKPWMSPFGIDLHSERYEPLNQDSVYYDDAMETIAGIAKDHNRIAIVLQGILDRSEALHPHPSWQLWTQEGFEAGIKLMFDSHGLTSGDPPDFEAYRKRLSATIVQGTNTVGQHDTWSRREAEKENRRQKNDWRIKYPTHHEHYEPYGNPGPGKVAQVFYIRQSKCAYRWERERLTHQWVSNPDKPGYMMRNYSVITTSFRCPITDLLNVDAYIPGDYKQFYDDHRTRADYLQWAPLLLAAEDFHAKKSKKK